jgi:DNA-binding transcriptional MocR family regulator
MSRTQIQGSNAAEIAASIERALHAGTWAAGHRLPTIRELATTLRVSPVTVASAYRLLQVRGLVIGGGRRGTHVRGQPHEVHDRPPADESAGRRQRAAIRPPEGAIDLASGNPDPDLLPALDPHLQGLSQTHHFYGDPLEFRPLAAFARAEFEADGIPSDDLTITNGTLDAVERVLREHVRPGDHVLVEDPTLPAVRDLVGSLGLTLHGCAIDDEGPDPDALERALGPRIRAAILSPRAQNPTGAAIGARRAADLGRILRRRPQTLLIEIDSAGPVSGVPAITLVDSARPHWAVIRSTSKFLNPDLRVAVMAADSLTTARVQRRQALGIRWVSHLMQALAHALWSDPSSGRGFARAAEIYRHRRTALVDALAANGVAAHAQSGFNVWVSVREEAATVSALAARGWMVAAGERFRLRSAPAIRVTTSALVPAEAQRLAADLAAVLRPTAVSSA